MDRDQLINYKAVCRTALATPGMSNMFLSECKPTIKIFQSADIDIFVIKLFVFAMQFLSSPSFLPWPLHSSKNQAWDNQQRHINVISVELTIHKILMTDFEIFFDEVNRSPTWSHDMYSQIMIFGNKDKNSFLYIN